MAEPLVLIVPQPDLSRMTRDELNAHHLVVAGISNELRSYSLKVAFACIAADPVSSPAPSYHPRPASTSSNRSNRNNRKDEPDFSRMSKREILDWELQQGGR
jgi:hypothetical protein